MECIAQRDVINKKRKDLLVALKNFIKFHPNKLMHLDKSYLEELLFETNIVLGVDYSTCNWGPNYFKVPIVKCPEDLTKIYKSENDIKRKGLIAKFPVWTGEFLRHIDLSEVDWSNVVWDYEVIENYDLLWLHNMDEFEYVTNPISIPDYMDQVSEYCVDLSGTNANIDFSKSFSAKLFKDGLNNLNSCNFKGLNLSNSNTTSINSVLNSDLRNTNFVINRNDFSAIGCDLRTLNLNGITTSFTRGYFDDSDLSVFIEHSNVADTGLYIKANTLEAEGMDFYLDQFGKDFENGFFNNCKVNLGIMYFDDDDDYDDDYDDDDDYGLGFGRGFRY